MPSPTTAQVVCELAIAGEEAGFSLEQMIELLTAAVGADALCHLVELRLVEANPSAARSSRWIM